MKHILLVDVPHLFWACYHASADKEVSYAAQWTIERVHKLSSGYDHVAICCDHPPYLRKKAYPEYKAQREAQPPMALEQFKRVRDRLAEDGFLLWSVQGYEADDIIATACAKLCSDTGELEVTIASNDKDLFQLISDERGVLLVKSQTGEEVRESHVREKFGIEPWQIRDLLSLMGDSSDNVPGCPGVGAKTAAKLLAEFGDIDAIYQRLEFVKPDGLREKLRANASAVHLSRNLVTLMTDAPINIDELFQERKALPMQEAVFEDAEQSQPEQPAPTRSEPPPVAAKSESPPRRQVDVDLSEARSTALARVEAPSWSLSLEPKDSGGAVNLAKKLYESRLFPGFPNEQAVLAVILRGRALGLDATTALSTFHVIEGRPSMHASLIVGLVLRCKACEYFELSESTPERALWVTKRVGGKREVPMSYDLEEARKAGLLRPSKSGKPSNWETRPKTMLRWRAATELARAVYPDIVTGLYTPDELSDGAVFEPKDAA
jgi:5'-3' exonuclease